MVFLVFGSLISQGSMTSCGAARVGFLPCPCGLCCHFDEVVHADYDADFHRYHVYFADHQDLIIWKLTYL